MKEKNDHPLNWKETQEILDPDRKQSWFINFLRDFENKKYPVSLKIFLAIGKLFYFFPPIRKAAKQSVGGTLGAFIKHWKSENFQEAYEVVLKKIKRRTTP